MGNWGYFHPEISGVYGPQQKITGFRGPPCRSSHYYYPNLVGVPLVGGTEPKVCLYSKQLMMQKWMSKNVRTHLSLTSTMCLVGLNYHCFRI